MVNIRHPCLFSATFKWKNLFIYSFFTYIVCPIIVQISVWNAAAEQCLAVKLFKSTHI